MSQSLWTGTPPDNATDANSRICMAALDCIKRHGYEKTTMRDIAEQAGIARPTLYKHFKAKEDVLFAGIDRVAFAFALAVANHARQFPTLEERIIETIVIVVEEMPQHPYLSMIFDEKMPAALRERAFSDEATEVFSHITSEPLVEICPALTDDSVDISETMSRFALSMILFPGKYAGDSEGLRALIKKRVLPGLIPQA